MKGKPFNNCIHTDAQGWGPVYRGCIMFGVTGWIQMSTVEASAGRG